jgi:electron transport complex protein RnfE
MRRFSPHHPIWNRPLTDRSAFAKRLAAGIWHENPGLVQLLGLCPLLAVTSSLVNGLGLGLATIVVLTLSNGLVSATRRWLRDAIRIPIYVLIIASLVTCIELIFKAWFPALDRSLGIFIPLIVTNCAIVARAELYASRNPVIPSLLDGMAMGSGFALLLCALGFVRELVGQGTMFARLDLLFGGDPMPGLQVFDSGFLLAILPPGAFIALGLAVAGKNALDQRRKQASASRLSI